MKGARSEWEGVAAAWAAGGMAILAMLFHGRDTRAALNYNLCQLQTFCY